MARRQVRDQRHPAKLHLITIVQHPVDRMWLAPWRHRLQRGYILGHGHYLRAGQLLDQRVALHMIPVSVTTQQNLDVREFESDCSTDF